MMVIDRHGDGGKGRGARSECVGIAVGKRVTRM
jgi:hypothetical protein